MKTNKLLLSIVSISMLAGCAFEPFKPGHAVHATGEFPSRSFQQDGKKVNPYELFNEFKQHEHLKENAEAGQKWFYAAAAGAGAGGFVIGYNIVSNSDNKNTNMLIGLGLVAAGFYAEYVSEKYLIEDIDLYNKKPFHKHAENPIKMAPLLTVTQANGDKNASPLLGLTASF